MSVNAQFYNDLSIPTHTSLLNVRYSMNQHNCKKIKKTLKNKKERTKKKERHNTRKRTTEKKRRTKETLCTLEQKRS